jgi:uncharacterized membrane protein
VYAFVKDAGLAAEITGVERGVIFALHYAHDRFWTRIPRGWKAARRRRRSIRGFDWARPHPTLADARATFSRKREKEERC